VADSAPLDSGGREATKDRSAAAEREPLRHAPEREIKLAAAPSFRLPDLAKELEGFQIEIAQPKTQRTTYFDTPDLRLARWGCSLRYRDTEGWTVKLPSESNGDALVREEVVFDGGPKEPPGGAIDLLRAYVRTAEVVPVTRLRTLRRSVVVRVPDAEQARDGDGDAAAGDGDAAAGIAAGMEPGSRVAEVVDDEVSVMDGRRLAARFRELEVEAGDGTSDEMLSRIVSLLRDAGAGEPDSTTKYVRAVGPRATGPAELVVDDLHAGASAGAVVRNAIAASVIRLLKHDAVVRLDAHPEGVHQARVATRRLRSDLRTFAPLLDPAWAVHLVDDLHWLADKLGAARDADVLMELLTNRVGALEGPDREAGSRLLERMAEERRVARADLMEAMRLPRYAAVLDRLVTAGNDPALLLEADLPAGATLPDLLRKPWRKLRQAVKQLDDPPTDDELHAVRIRAKRLRYAAEAVAPLLGKPARDLGDAAADLQDVLGRHNDAVVAGRWLREAAARARSARTAFVAGELAGLERWSAAETRDTWRAAWKRVQAKRPKAWT
jgi:CHAD domain-containing protein